MTIAIAPMISDDPAPMTSGRILVVDDDDGLRTLIAGYLGDNGFDTREARSVAELRDILAAESFDVIILDVLMPEEDGLSALRGMGRHVDASIILLSTLAHDVDRIVGLELGADDYIAKPCNPRELLARVRAVLRRRQPRGALEQAGGEAQGGPPSHGISGKWVLDTGNWILTAPDGRNVDLSTSELRLLAGMASAKGRVLTRDQLMGLYAPSGEIFDRAIDVHISRLRKKLRPMGGDFLIRTIRGEGYGIGTGLICR